MFLFITVVLSACLLLFMATTLSGRWALPMKFVLVAISVANAVIAAQHLPAILS